MSATDQTSAMAGMSPAAASEESYGLGWRRNQGSLSRSASGMWGGHLEGEADGAGAAWEASVVFGHGGATGATAFADPVSGISCVLLTTDPSLGESGVVRELSGMVLAAGRESSAVFAALGVRTHAALLVTLLPPSLLTVAKWPNVVDIVHCPPSMQPGGTINSIDTVCRWRRSQDKLREFQNEDNRRQAEGAAGLSRQQASL